ncbi:MerR family transcriptional regulator [Pseudogracilibacillus sp. SO30301A]|uniref:MerR family transcriptional regulator n=1 Tax=Pseudogracilibacillus sp. SO30301A TaxID=3098291 RepID=UPI00300E1D6C
MISIKEVTKQTGISVRTLRYYDEINLLPPAGKTEGGHRLYGEKELKKLQEIQFLKTLGFNLKEISDMLSDEDWDWAQGLESQLNYIMKEKEKILEIESTLKGLKNGLTIDGKIDLVYLNKLIQLYKQDTEKRKLYREQYFHAQESELLDLLPNMNRNDPDTLEWIALIGQLKQHRDKGSDAPEIQRIIRRIHEKTIETFGDNENFFDKVWEVRKSPEKSQKVGFYPIEQDLIDFFERAWDIFMENYEEE